MKKTIGTKLITYIKRLKLKIQSRVWNFKNTMLKKEEEKKKKHGQKITKYIYEVCFKNRVFFFCKVIVGYKNEKGVIEDSKIFLIF